MDVDFGDLDGPAKAPAAKTSKFAPKNSKFKPVAKPKREPGAPVPSSEPNPIAVPKAELDDSKPPQSTPAASVYSNIEIEQPPHTLPTSHDGNGSVKMDTDATDMEIDNDTGLNEEDQVVREIDVFFTSTVDANSKLYVLQYPLRPSWRPYELEERCEKVRLKPETAEVEVELSVEVASENFDTDFDDDRAMAKQVLSTAWQPLTATRYAVGIITGNELHLNPVHAVVQLRPSMQHLDPLKKTHDEDMIDIKIEKAVKQTKKQINQSKLVNEQNANTPETKEQWIPLKYHGETSHLSRGYVQKMVAQESSEIQFPMSQSDYIDCLCPATSDKPKPKGPSRSSLLKLPLEERLKIQLLEGPPVQRFNALKHIAPDHSEEDILTVLKTHAQLVQGLWVPTSNLKFDRKDGKDVLLRNYVLLQFSRNIIYHEKQFPKSTLVVEAMKPVLDEFGARRDTYRDWKFKETPDLSFIKKYEEVVVEQDKKWDSLEPQIMERLFKNNSKHRSGDKPVASSSNNDVTRKTTNVVQPSRTPVSDETREALPKALQKLFQAYKVCSLNQILHRLRDMAVSENTLRKGTREARAAAAAADAPKEELQKVLDQLAVNIHGVFVLRSSPDYPQYDGLRNIVINLFIAEGREGKLKKATIFAAASAELKREITNVEYQKVLTELCISKNSAWVLKSGDVPT